MVFEKQLTAVIGTRTTNPNRSKVLPRQLFSGLHTIYTLSSLPLFNDQGPFLGYPGAARDDPSHTDCTHIRNIRRVTGTCRRPGTRCFLDGVKINL